MAQHTPRIALVGDRSANVRAHARIPGLIDALLKRDSIALDPYWIATPDAAECDLSGFDAIWVAPGSPYESAVGAIAAVRTAREKRIPYLGTCGGFQHALIEYARNVCGLVSVENAESHPDADDQLIVPLECSLMGHEEAVMVVPGTLAAKITGPGRRTERYHCSYGLNQEYLETLTDAGVRFSGFDDSGHVRIMELSAHPFFMGTLFQPELQGDGTQPHPIIRAFAVAASERAASRPATLLIGRLGARVSQQDEVVRGQLHHEVAAGIDQLREGLDDPPVWLARRAPGL
jgi:CTP synthase (UTP-ammonia lyase)